MLEILPQPIEMRVRAIKIEGHQRNLAYVAQVTKTWREAIDPCHFNPHYHAPKPAWRASLDQPTQGQQHTGRLPPALEMMMNPALKIAPGQLQNYWPRDTFFSFCQTMTTASVDVVCLAESVGSSRRELRLVDWRDIAVRLQDAGKEVVSATRVLLESGAEVGTLPKIAATGNLGVQANDMGAVQRLARQLPFAA